MIGHEIITASAGSGKTWNLTLRYIRLLAMGANPAAIIALTFSRKAAGEFLTAILHRLATAAATDTAAARLATDAEMPQLTRRDFAALLAALVNALPALTLGTMDSFFVRMARSFPLELGLAGDFSILSDHQQSMEQDRVLRRIFAPGAMNEAGRQEFLLAFQQATWGRDEVRLRQLLEDFIDQWHILYLAAPDADRWGNPAAIWPEGGPLAHPGPPMSECIAAARRHLSADTVLKEKQKDTLTHFLTTFENTLPGKTLDATTKGVLGKLLQQLPDLAAGAAEITLRTKVMLTGPLAGSLRAVVLRYVIDALTICLHQTRGIYGIVALYDRNYSTLVRRQGKLTFHDVQLILSGSLRSDDAASGLAAQARESLDYRLDARYQHWLLDEFQDTSRTQWNILQTLCDEVIQDDSDSRTFFAVGDEKQSIFNWRGAEPGLFGELLRHYNHAGERIKVRPLALSQRSGPAVISMVNRLCGNVPRLAELERIAEAAARWPWQEHQSAHPDRPGCAAVIEVPVEKDAGEEKTDAVWEAAGELLRQLQPLKRGLSCAVIVSRNQRARDGADALRRLTGMEVICESEVSIATDNPAASTLLAMVKAAAHPADRFSWQQVMMSPLGPAILKEYPADGERTVQERTQLTRHRFTTAMLQQIADGGFEACLRAWQARLLNAMPALDSFNRGRLDELCHAAQEFDAQGERDPDDFVAFAENWRVRESSHPSAIQVMTLHKSKGLTFDIVILPDFHDTSMHRHYSRTGIRRTKDSHIAWVSQLPSKDIAQADPVLSSALDEWNATQWRERIAQLYVAVTRAVHANYILLPPPPEKASESVNFPAIIRHMLGSDAVSHHTLGTKDCALLSVDGDMDWIQAFPVKTTPPQVAPAADLFAAIPAETTTPARPQRPARLRPSAAAKAITNRAGRRFGTLVHECFARVEWLEKDTISALREHFSSRHPRPEAWQKDALEVVLSALEAPALRPAFQRPAEDAIVWREQPFLQSVDGEIISGVFDRVILERDASGRFRAARIIDFKTDRMHDSGDSQAVAAKYRPQLHAYRKALTTLTGLAVNSITTEVLLPGRAELVSV